MAWHWVGPGVGLGTGIGTGAGVGVGTGAGLGSSVRLGKPWQLDPVQESRVMPLLW